MSAFVPLTGVQLPNTYRRRKTREVRVGDIGIGGNNPVRVQTMITAETMNTPAAVEQIIQLYEAGAEIVRVTAPNLREAQNLGEIKAELRRRGYGHIPLVADVHHQGMEIALECTKHVEKIRINPGLFVFRKPDPSRVEYSPSEIQQELEAIEQALLPVIRACKERGVAMRIGVNHGSLSERIKVMYGDSPVGMVESALEYIRICESHGFKDIVISLKASRVPVMLSANRLMVERMNQLGMDYPLHLGVTEAGDGMYARIKSAIGIGTLLAEGIGDTIRVSLAEDPLNEIEACYDILQALGLRKTKVEYIACPSCGRTKFDLPTVLNQVREATRHLVGLDIAVMGCLPPDQPVMTETGLKPIHRIQVGERVLTEQGTLEPVSAIESHSFEGELIEIVPRGAPPLRLTPNHPVLALTRSCTIKGDRPRWQNMADLINRWQEARWYPAQEITRNHVLLYPVLKENQISERVPDEAKQIIEYLQKLWRCDGYCGVVRGYPRASYVTVSPALAFVVHQLLLRLGIPASLTVRQPANRQRTYIISVTSGDGLRRFADRLGFKVEVPESRQRTGRLVLDSRYLYLPVAAVRRLPYRGTVHNLEVAHAHTYVGSLCVVHNCIVNGPGEMADADYGYVGRGSGKIALYRKGQLVKNDIPAERGVEELIALLKADGVWRDPPATTHNDGGQ